MTQAQLLTPSAELTAQIEVRLDALTASPFSFLGYCRDRRMLPLHSTLIYTWALQPDGTVQWIDHEAFGYPAEPETDRRKLWAVLEQGARRYPELAALLPPEPTDLARCTSCGGVGHIDGEHCFSCNGLGWR